jgi:hypothetical protein
MPAPLDALLCAALLGGWTFMWLVWMLDADVRSWLAAGLFPGKWLGARTRSSIASMSPTAFVKWLVSSQVPLQVCQLVTCPRCLSAHLSAVGTLLLAASGALSWWLAPLSWAAGAGIGNLLYGHYKRTHKD